MEVGAGEGVTFLYKESRRRLLCVKKRLKISLFVIGLCIMFIFGYLYAGHRDYLDRQKEVLFTAERVKEHDEIWFQGYISKAWKYDLTEEEQNFLLEHVFGKWYFSKRMTALKEGDESAVNFSEQGIEAIKDNVFMTYTRFYTESSGYTESIFSTKEDMYLFAAYGGMASVQYPVYHIETDAECELVHVYYDLGYDEQENASVDVCYACDIYVNPEDTDVLYLDFGGLWELKRVKK